MSNAGRTIPLIAVACLAVYVGTRGSDNLRAAYDGLMGAESAAKPVKAPASGKATTTAAGTVGTPDVGAPAVGGQVPDGGNVIIQGMTGGYFSLDGGG